MTSKSQSVWKVAVAKQSYGLWFWNLVYVGNDYDVAFVCLPLCTNERREGFVQHLVLHKAFVDPDIGIVDDFIVYFEMKDLIFEFLEPVPVVSQDGWVRKTSKRCGKFDDNKVVDIGSQSPQPNFEPVELQHEREDVVDLAAGAIVQLVRGETVLAARPLDIIGVWCAGSPEIARDQIALQSMSRGSMSMSVGKESGRIVPNREQKTRDKEC